MQWLMVSESGWCLRLIDYANDAFSNAYVIHNETNTAGSYGLAASTRF